MLQASNEHKELKARNLTNKSNKKGTKLSLTQDEVRNQIAEYKRIKNRERNVGRIKAAVFVLSIAAVTLPLVGIVALIYLDRPIPLWFLPIAVFVPLLGAVWLMTHVTPFHDRLGREK